MSFLEHLEELRRRILVSLFCVLIAGVFSFFFAGRVLNFVINWVNIKTAYFFSPTEAFVAQIKVAIFMGIFISFPIILYETWAFIGPGLTKQEQKISIPFIASGFLLFLLGLAFSAFVLIPFGLKSLSSFGSENIQPLMNINRVLEFIFWCLLCSGLLFEIPLLLFFLIKLGLVQLRTIARHRPEIIVGIIIIAAVITPTGDMFTLLLISLPLILLIEISLLLARLSLTRKPH